jgi:hypothetical protein
LQCVNTRELPESRKQSAALPGNADLALDARLQAGNRKAILEWTRIKPDRMNPRHRFRQNPKSVTWQTQPHHLRAAPGQYLLSAPFATSSVKLG